MEARKTNAARLLDKAKIAYELIPYAVDENDLSARHLAAQLGRDGARVFKTLVLKGDRTGYFVCVVPGDAEVDLKKAAKVSGNKNAAMIPMKDLATVTGYVRGGCSPLAMKKALPTYIHESASEHGFLYVSAGVRGMQIRLSPGGLLRAANAALADLVPEKDSPLPAPVRL
jgi:Cys-tRNA(Pro)/Cys-tRNA(Cys) deacylase